MARAWPLRQRESAHRRDFRRLFNYALQETLPVAIRTCQRRVHFCRFKYCACSVEASINSKP